MTRIVTMLVSVNADADEATNDVETNINIEIAKGWSEEVGLASGIKGLRKSLKALLDAFEEAGYVEETEANPIHAEPK